MMEFKFKHPKSGEVIIINLTNKEITDLIEDELYDMICNCGCEPVGETNVVECGCIDYLEGFILQKGG